MQTVEKLFNDPKVTKQIKTQIKELKKSMVSGHHNRLEELLTKENITFKELDNRITIPITNPKTNNKVKLIIKQIKEEYPNLDFLAMIVVTDKTITIKNRRK